MITNIRAGLSHVLASTPQLQKSDRWPVLVSYIVDRILSAKSQTSSPPGLPLVALAWEAG
jgi:hypothetical protein